MKKLLRFWKRGPWSATLSATPWAQKAMAATYIRQTQLNLMMQWPALGMVIALIWGHAANWTILLWGSIFTSCLIFSDYRYRKNASKTLSADSASRLLANASRRVLIVGGLWGSTVYFLPLLPPSHQIAMALIAMGHGFAASSRLSSIPRGALFFQLSVTLPYMGFYLLHPTLPALLICGGMLAGLIAMAQSAHMAHRQLMTSLRAVHQTELAIEALEESCAQWAEINETAEAVALYDIDEGLLLWNDAYARLLGLPRESLRRGLTWKQLAAMGARNLFHLDYNGGPSEKQQWPGARQAEAGSMAQCVCQVDHLWLRSTARRINAQRLAVSHVDITALKDREMQQIALQEELRSARDAAQSASSAKSRFLANMSHEIRTPLNAVIGFADLMMHEHKKGPVETRRHLEYLQLIHDSGQHLLAIVEDMLDLALVESGRIKLMEADVDLVQLVRQSARIATGRLHDLHIHLIDELPQKAITVHADARLLRQAVINIVSNSMKFSTQNGRIWLHIDQQPDALAIRIRDEGVGIAAHKLGLVLEPFAQAEAGDRRRFGGLGLGLPLARQFMESHGGKLQLESTEGEGTTVTLYLPISRLHMTDSVAA